jgi:hypothetical protein
MVNYYFEKNQSFKVELYDEDEPGTGKLIGEYSDGMNKLLTQKRMYLKGELIVPEKLRGKNKSYVSLFAESVGESNVEIRMKIGCNLVSKRRNFFRKMLACCRQAPDEPYVVVEREMFAMDEEKATRLLVATSEK